MSAVQVKVSGLKGGHSGVEIDRGRGNAIKILIGRFLLLMPSAPGSFLSKEETSTMPFRANAKLF